MGCIRGDRQFYELVAPNAPSHVKGGKDIPGQTAKPEEQLQHIVEIPIARSLDTWQSVTLTKDLCTHRAKAAKPV